VGLNAELRGAALAATLLLLAAPLPAADVPGFRARVVAVHDGDTLTVLRNGDSVNVRLEGIDCPELGQPYSRVARQRAVQLALHHDVEVVGSALDSHGRLLARVLVDRQDVSEVLVREGLAWHFVRYSSDATLAQAEHHAREQGSGLWREQHPIPPWEWRRGARGTEVTPRPLASAASSLAVHGNARSRVYHRPGCAYYNCPNCRAVFPTPDLAEAEGYRPAHCCNRRP
jgi:endonuclease YncB( thermonuclease family)